MAAKTEPAKPEQVVQRIEPTPNSEPPSVTVLQSAAGRRSAAAPRSAAGAPDKRAAIRGGSISSKHLEAELNRLEAELK
ncbi:MAG: hypothetical protein ABI895_15570 [Deltaproteobacteria bacterium]